MDPHLPPSLQDELAEIAFREPDPAARAALRESLIARHPEHAAALRAAVAEASGPTSIGPFRIEALLGEGGFGRVYRARQTSGVERTVALKVLRNDSDSRGVLARFELERHVLASMNHDAIARFFEAGQVDGQPWFSMELVSGVPITDYCDAERLTIAERLQLFVQVCEGVQHAHGKGIVHRDLKPANVLVSRGEHGHVAKIIDFGIARATDRQLSQSMQTVLGMVLGTPEYMAPEQCGGDPLQIDARTDVYTLGVMLYELVSGQLPFAADELPRNELLTVQRVLLQKDPPKPSTRIASLGVEGADAARRRRLSPTTWRRAVSGDLDDIVGRAMEKEQVRRYQSVADLAADLRRHLAYEPIDARPPSRAYRLRKFVRRYRWHVTSTAAVVLTALVGTVVAVQFASAESRTAADLARVVTYQFDQLARIEPGQVGAAVRNSLLAALAPSEREEVERCIERVNFADLGLEVFQRAYFDHALEAIGTRFAAQPLIQADLLQAVAHAQREMGAITRAEGPQERALKIRLDRRGSDHPETIVSMNNMTALLRAKGDLAAAQAIGLEAEATARRALGDDDPLTLIAIGNVASILDDLGKSQEAEARIHELIERTTRVHGEDHEATIASQMSLAVHLQAQSRFDDAETCYRRAMETSQRVLGPEHAQTLTVWSSLAVLLQERNELAEAERLCRLAWMGRRKVLGEFHPDTLISAANLGSVLASLGRLDEAERVDRDVVAQRSAILGIEHPDTLLSLNNLGAALLRAGKLQEAENVLTGTLDDHRRILGEGHDRTLAAATNLATALLQLGKLAESEAQFDRLLPLCRQHLGDRHVRTVTVMNNLASCLDAQGKFAEAEPLLRDAVAASRDVMGENHPNTLTTLSKHAIVLCELGRFEEAEVCAREAAERRKTQFGESNPDAMKSLRNLGRLLEMAGKAADATPCFRDLVEVTNRSFGAEDQRSIVAEADLAGNLLQVGHIEEALTLLQQVEDAARTAFSASEPARYAGHLVSHARALILRGRAVDLAVAEPKLLDAYRILTDASAPAPQKLKCCETLVELYAAWEKLEPGGEHSRQVATWRHAVDDLRSSVK